MRGTTQQLAQYMAEGFWRDRNDIPRSFDLANEGGTVEVDLTRLGPTGQALATTALNEWSAITDIEFVGVERGGDIVFTNDESTYAQTSWSYTSGGTIVSATVNVPASTIDSDPEFGDEAYLLYLHEVGHALGLGHPGPYNELPNGEDNADPNDRRFDNDTYLQSVTSYFSPTDDTEAETGFARPITPMAADIEAMRILYGTSGIRGGDTTYGGANNNAGAAFASFDTGMLATVADTGGTDTIDLSNVEAGMRLDLRQGSISTFIGNEGGLVIAQGTVIENATGSGQQDRITGNSLANVLVGGGGNDTLNGGVGYDTLYGGAGSDLLAGGGGNDALFGWNGADRFYGGYGNDRMSGGAGNDRLFGFNGNDVLNGHADNDILSGEGGNDVLRGGAGNDTLYGGAGNDLLSGGSGNDMMSGWNGDDRFYGGYGEDQMYGGAGRDRLFGYDGDDVLDGEAGGDIVSGEGGNDVVRGGIGYDTLYGGAGNDLLVGGGGNDTMSGWNGDDRFYGGYGDDTMSGGAGTDRLFGYNGNDVLNGNADGDILSGEAGNDTLNGGTGYDALYGGGGDDILSGEGGNDALSGWNGNDRLYGGYGNDRLDGGKGTDFLSGYDGNDTLNGGAGDDALSGGTGSDTFIFDSFRSGETDTLTDFEDGTDLMRMSDVQGGFGALNVSSIQDGATVGYEGHTIVLEGLQASQINSDDFIFV